MTRYGCDQFLIVYWAVYSIRVSGSMARLLGSRGSWVLVVWCTVFIFLYSLIASLKLVTRAFDEFGGEYCWDISVIMNVCGDEIFLVKW